MKKLEKFDYLSSKDNFIHLFSNNVLELCTKLQIPCYIFLPQRFTDNYAYFVRAMKRYLPKFQIAYAVKANYMGAVLKLANNLKSGVEVMSLFELLLAQRAGFTSDKIIMNGPAKSDEELKFVIRNEIKHLNVDSFSELKHIEYIAKKQSKVRSISVRIHPQLNEKIEKKLLIKKNSKLGMDYARARKLYKYAKNSPNLEIKGLHLHIGTNLASHEFYDELLNFLNKYVQELENELGVFLETINLGGGLASRVQLKEKGFQLEFLAKQIKEHIDGVKDREIIFELGRYLVADSFVAIANVIRVKKSWGRRWAFIDIGANTLIPLRYSNFFLVPVVNKGKGQATHIGGPLCLPVDIVSEKAVDFAIDEGDKVLILNCGAYTLSMSEQFGYPRPPIFELSDDGVKLLNKGDNLTDMVNFWF